MEKFAVDLDKVLDDFELNEDQAERFAAKSKPSTPLPKVQPQPLPTQPLLSRHLLDKRDSHHEASERSLRRINLLDADFAPDPHPQVLSFSSSQEKSTVVINDSSHPVYSATLSQPPLANGQSTAEEEEAEEEKACSNNSDKVPSNGDIPEDSHGACISPPSVPPTVNATGCPPHSVNEWNQGRRSPEEAGDCHSPDLPVSNTVDGCDSNPSILSTGDEGPVRSSRDCLSVDVVVPMAPDSDRPVPEVGDGPVPCSVEDGECLPQRRDSVELEQPAVEEGMGIAEDVESGEDAVGERVEGECQLPSQHEVTRPISFKAEEELSDVDFAKYLAELEQEEEEPGVVHEAAREVEVDSSSVEAKGEGEGVKVVEGCREEAWEEEGSGRALLDGAIGASLPAPIASTPPPCEEKEGGEEGESCRGEEGRGVAAATPPAQRPGTLPLVAVDALPPPPVPAAKEEEEEDSSIPIPLVIGPPGATPANPWPPSDISAQAAALRVNESASGSLPCVVGVVEGATVGRTGMPPNLPKVMGGAYPSYAETQPAPEGEEVKVEGHLSQALSSSSSSSSEADEAGVGNDLEGGGEGASGGGSNDSSSPEVAPSGPVEQLDSVGMSEGDLSSSPVAQADIVVGEESRMSHGSSSGGLSLGDVAPFWVPDADAPACMLCMSKFTLIKRRHHCRACGKVLCSKCCSFKARLAYMDHSEARVCAPCQSIIAQEAAAASPTSGGYYPPNSGRQGDCLLDQASDHSPPRRSGASRPDPNNPMEYCSTVPPLEQVGERARAPPPSVMVPVGVLKREGSSSRSKGETTKQVMFSDGIRPGGDLTDLDRSPNVASASGKPSSALSAVQRKIASRLAKRAATGTGCPPEYNFEEGPELDRLVETLTDESQPPVAFALSKNFFVLVKIITMDCCVNRVVWSFTTRGMRCVGQDEVVVLLDWLPSDKGPPRDIFRHLSALYEQASKGNTVTELGHSMVQGSFLGSHSHGGFLYIRATFQCLRRLPLPPPPYLFGLLLHRMETPWAKVFPIRVMLRLGAEFRYYPCPLVGVRGREPVYHQIGHTIMNLLSDFRNFTYVLPSVRGMVIHMEERQTSILLPRNRLSMVERALDDSDDHVLALSASFSTAADSHLVCVQGEPGDASSGHYHTQAINIQNKPRKVTGASFVVFNGALKVSSKLTAKSSIVEDGLMVQVLPDTLVTLRNALRNGEDFVIPCGPISPASPPPPPPPAPVEPEEQEAQSAADDAVVPQLTQSATQPSAPDEVIIIRWVEDDKNFNIGVKSPIDGMALDGVPSIRVHNGTNYMSDTKFIRWTEVFLIQQNGEAQPANSRGDTMDVNRISESIAHAVCLALHPYLDMLWSHALTLIAVRATLGPDSEGYEAGCGGSRLPPIYMNSLDNELIGVLHRIEWRPTESSSRPLVLELLFHLMEL